MIQTLIKTNKYNGRYVAIEDFDNSTVVGEGLTPKEAYEHALEKGCKQPVLIFVPTKFMVQIY
jgi:hypothetical protein